MAIVKQVKIDNFRHCTGASLENAIAYLQAEEWIVVEAVKTYLADKAAGLIR